jgi:hypothetical protein
MGEPKHLPDDSSAEEKPGIPRPGGWSDVMEELITEAMAEGAFDNLPGRGKPLNLSTNWVELT